MFEGRAYLVLVCLDHFFCLIFSVDVFCFTVRSFVYRDLLSVVNICYCVSGCGVDCGFDSKGAVCVRFDPIYYLGLCLFSS